MTFFNCAEPIFRCKHEALDIQDLRGLWRLQCRIGDFTLFSGLYTRIDQVFILWSLITAIIFTTAQFVPISWSVQAVFWSALTLWGTYSTVSLTWFWATVERLHHVIYYWVALMLAGLALTNFAIFVGCGEILIRLCPLWLGVSSLGYLLTGIGVRSRTFVIIGLFHLFWIAVLPAVGAWQFLTTGGVLSASLLLLAEIQWDMRPPIDFNLLSTEQKQFNQEQQRLRQGKVNSSFSLR